MLNRPNIETRFSARVLEAWANTNLPTSFTVNAAADGKPAEIILHDEIGPFGVTSKQFNAALKQIGDGPLTLHINSGGGDVFDGISMFNALTSHKGEVSVVVDGLAASAASVIAMAGDNIAMHESAMLMVHNAHCIAIGNRHDMTEIAATLEKVDGQLANIYAARTGHSPEEMAALMDAESWLTSTDAKETGFADSIIETPKKEPIGEVEPQIMAQVEEPVVELELKAETEPATADSDASKLRLRVLQAKLRLAQAA